MRGIVGMGRGLMMAAAASVGLLSGFAPINFNQYRYSAPVRANTSGKSKPPKRRRTTTFHARNGQRECERRCRQIAAGSLRVENGLVPS